MHYSGEKLSIVAIFNLLSVLQYFCPYNVYLSEL